MEPARLSLIPKRWYACDLLSSRALEDSWPSTPIFMTDVSPLKTGKGILRLSFVAALHPISPQKSGVDLRIIHHRPDHLVGTFLDEAGEHTMAVSIPTFEWFEFRCHDFSSRFPSSNFEYNGWTLIIDGAETNLHRPMRIDEYLAHAFGGDEKTVLNGATEESFPLKLFRLPKARATLRLDCTFTPMQSFLLGRGFVPREMEEKWFIYMSGDHLVFRRSWTGFYIYRVMLERLGNQLRATSAFVNRNTKQYSETAI
jgi:hypothetical protein